MIESFNKWFGVHEQVPPDEVSQINVKSIIANPFQPRTHFDEEKIDELAKSIQLHGVIQPIIVRNISDGNYEIVAGERRWRAATKIGWTTIPAIIRQLTDEQTATIALIENLQREGLTAIEEANAFQQLLLLQSITQEELADQLGKSQSTVANKLRLLNLTDEVKEAIYERIITERHARSLLRLESEEQKKLLKEVVDKDLSVQQLDTKIKYILQERNELKIKRVSYTKDVRLAINTVRQAVDMIKMSQIPVSSEETDFVDYVEFKIQIYKKK